ncbi:MAG TPA: RsiV family protein [Ignavibacteria bacterium]|nr:RsiV family protein [Ignavibacteria bacterium]HQY52586.1 RsiV family protein [Ignavibacteria bacterium]HRB00796.1 RsiV family protein [Ignavibacteria bacterium]
MRSIILTLIFFAVSISASAQQMNITYKNEIDKNEKLNYMTDVTYPQVDFGPEALMGVRGIAQDINTAINESVQNYIESFKTQLEEIKGDSKEGESNSFKITSEAEITGGTLLSVKFTMFSNISGMAHPMTNDSSFNYSTISTGQLELKDLFREESEYLKFISAYSQKELEAYAYSQGNENIFDMIKLGTSPDANNFKVWNIKNDSLSITFNPYQAAPYVFGIQEVKISLSEMLSMFDKTGPLEFLFR